MKNNWEAILEAVIEKWNSEADEYNQWEALRTDEQFELIIKFCMSIPRRVKSNG